MKSHNFYSIKIKDLYKSENTIIDSGKIVVAEMT